MATRPTAPMWLDVGLDLFQLVVVVAFFTLDVSDWIFLAALIASWIFTHRVRGWAAGRCAPASSTRRARGSR